MNAIIDKLRSLLFRRKQDYCLTFSGPVADRVLADLAKFCRGRESTFHEDARLHAVLEGRREVWLRITNHLDLTNEQLARIYNLVEESKK